MQESNRNLEKVGEDHDFEKVERKKMGQKRTSIIEQGNTLLKPLQKDISIYSEHSSHKSGEKSVNDSGVEHNIFQKSPRDFKNKFEKGFMHSKLKHLKSRENRFVKNEDSDTKPENESILKNSKM